MQQSRAKTIKGLSIAVVILSILSILGLLFALIFFGVGGAALSDPSIRESASYSLTMDPDAAYSMEQLGLTEDDAFGIVGVLLGLGAAYVVWGVICSLVALIAGIMGIRNCNKVNKLGGAFGWAIAGAVTSFLYGNIVTCVLLIISAVCISRDRKASTAIPYGQPAAYVPPQQPTYAAPQQQPQQFTQPQQPQNPGQNGQQQ